MRFILVLLPLAAHAAHAVLVVYEDGVRNGSFPDSVCTAGLPAGCGSAVPLVSTSTTNVRRRASAS